MRFYLLISVRRRQRPARTTEAAERQERKLLFALELIELDGGDPRTRCP
jgi:hypothetical protein